MTQILLTIQTTLQAWYLSVYHRISSIINKTKSDNSEADNTNMTLLWNPQYGLTGHIRWVCFEKTRLSDISRHEQITVIQILWNLYYSNRCFVIFPKIPSKWGYCTSIFRYGWKYNKCFSPRHKILKWPMNCALRTTFSPCKQTISKISSDYFVLNLMPIHTNNEIINNGTHLGWK